MLALLRTLWRSRLFAALAPLATALMGLAALWTGAYEHHHVIGEAYAIEMFVTMPFMLILVAAASVPSAELSRLQAWAIRSVAGALYVLCASFPVYKMFGLAGFAGFCWLTFATYSGFFIHRRFDDLRRVLFPVFAWWAALIVLLAAGAALNGLGFKAGEKNADNYYVWPAGTIACGVLYFALLAWLELSGRYDRTSSLTVS